MTTSDTVFSESDSRYICIMEWTRAVTAPIQSLLDLFRELN